VRSEVPRVVNAHIYGSYSKAASKLFFRFRGGRPLHSVLTLIILRLMEVTTARFTTSNSKVSPRVSYNVFWFPRCSSCLLLRPLMPLPVVVSFLRCSRCLEPWFLIPLLPSWRVRCLLSSVCPWAPLATLSLPGPLQQHSLRRTGMAWRVIPLQFPIQPLLTPDCHDLGVWL
jgi:hypothetical protein